MSNQRNSHKQEFERAWQAAVTEGMTDEDTHLVGSISHRVKKRILQRIARRFKGTQCPKETQQVTLTDQMQGFEDLARVFLSALANGANLETALGVKALNTARRLELIATDAAGSNSETKAVMEAGLAESRARILKIWEEMGEQYWEDLAVWMTVGDEERLLACSELSKRILQGNASL